ncbi:MAG: YXWGXW repeat-containing protein, partial [Candidatus Sulfotelmatobacter sp.]
MPITSKTRLLWLAVAVLTMAVLAMTTTSFAQVRVAIAIAPPALPIYEQPVCPGDGFLWTPGYWAYDDDISDYYWVPGTWVMAPEVGFLWTPPYWGWVDGGFVFYDGYWGPHVGFYGGIAYGFGYFGVGFQGGRWDNGHFFYNRAVTNVEITNIHNVYNTTVVHETTVNRVSYNGGNGGVTARPTAEEEAAARERHVPPVSAQTEHMQSARSNPQLRASMNQGKPPIAATPRPGAFNDRAARPAKEAGAPYHAPANAGAKRGQPEERGNEPAGRAENNSSRPATAIHPNDLPRAERAAAPNTGNTKMDKKYQQ